MRKSTKTLSALIIAAAALFPAAIAGPANAAPARTAASIPSNPCLTTRPLVTLHITTPSYAEIDCGFNGDPQSVSSISTPESIFYTLLQQPNGNYTGVSESTVQLIDGTTLSGFTRVLLTPTGNDIYNYTATTNTGNGSSVTVQGQVRRTQSILFGILETTFTMTSFLSAVRTLP